MTRQYGSLQNLMGSRLAPATEITVGMGATELFWTDRTPYEVISVKDQRHITVRKMDWERTDSLGPSESQEYKYTSNESNLTKELFLTHKNKWREREGRKLGATFILGVMERYYDFTF